jgi:hypothetical protein
MNSNRKVRLDLDAIGVDSFETERAGPSLRGTVRAHSVGMVVTSTCDTNAVDSRAAGCTEHVLLCADYTTPQYCGTSDCEG